MSNENTERLKKLWLSFADERLSKEERMKDLDNIGVRFNYDEKTKSLYATDQFGLMLTKAKLEFIVSQMDIFFEKYSDSSIDDYNQKVWVGMEESDRESRNPIVRRERNNSGYVYLLKIEGDNIYKIGMTTKTPTQRLAQFVPKMPYKAQLIETIRSVDALELEYQLHTYYISSGCERVNGEWFRLTKTDIDFFHATKKYQEGNQGDGNV